MSAELAAFAVGSPGMPEATSAELSGRGVDTDSRVLVWQQGAEALPDILYLFRCGSDFECTVVPRLAGADLHVTANRCFKADKALCFDLFHPAPTISLPALLV